MVPWLIPHSIDQDYRIRTIYVTIWYPLIRSTLPYVILHTHLWDLSCFHLYRSTHILPKSHTLEKTQLKKAQGQLYLYIYIYMCMCARARTHTASRHYTEWYQSCSHLIYSYGHYVGTDEDWRVLYYSGIVGYSGNNFVTSYMKIGRRCSHHRY
jgi:hypothetical protein